MKRSFQNQVVERFKRMRLEQSTALVPYDQPKEQEIKLSIEWPISVALLNSKPAKSYKEMIVYQVPNTRKYLKARIEELDDTDETMKSEETTVDRNVANPEGSQISSSDVVDDSAMEVEYFDGQEMEIY